MSWAPSPVGRWHSLVPGSLSGELAAACGAWTVASALVPLVRMQDAQPAGACERCLLVVNALTDTIEFHTKEATRHKLAKRKVALERHMAMGLCRAEAARLLGITDAQARTALGVR